MRRATSLVACAIVFAAWQTPAHAASHQWRFNEIFSNADGTVQFIEMKECCGLTSETQLAGKWILAVNAAHQFDLDANLTGNTANKFLLLGTQAFADLPGAPTPDFIIPDHFLPLGDDTLEYWLYSAAVWSYSGLPANGTLSLARNGTTDVNSPTNFAGETGTIDATVPVEHATWGALKAIWNLLPVLP